MATQMNPRALIELAQARATVQRLEHELGVSGAAGSAPEQSPALADQMVWRLLSDHASDMISIHAANGDYLFVSPSARRLFGWEPQQLVGTNAYQYFHPDDLAAIAESHASQTEDDPDFHRIRYRLRRPDGGWLWVETRSESHRTDEGIEQIVCITRDISSAHALDEALRASNERLTRFAGIAAHDLKGPLTTIAGSTELVRMTAKGRLDPSEDQRLAGVERAAWRLAGLVDQLLEWATIEADTAGPELTDLGALAREVVAELEADIEAAEAQVVVGDLPSLVVQRQLTAMLLQNLVGNALKFRRPGVTPEVSVGATATEDDRWRICVSDNGPRHRPRHVRAHRREAGRADLGGGQPVGRLHLHRRAADAVRLHGRLAPRVAAGAPVARSGGGPGGVDAHLRGRVVPEAPPVGRVVGAGVGQGHPPPLEVLAAHAGDVG
jgi:PAS domain S-box-containing protein